MSQTHTHAAVYTRLQPTRVYGGKGAKVPRETKKEQGEKQPTTTAKKG